MRYGGSARWRATSYDTNHKNPTWNRFVMAMRVAPTSLTSGSSVDSKITPTASAASCACHSTANLNPRPFTSVHQMMPRPAAVTPRCCTRWNTGDSLMDSPNGNPRDTPSTKLNRAMPTTSRTMVERGSAAYTSSGGGATMPRRSRSSSVFCAWKYMTSVTIGSSMLTKNAVLSSTMPMKMPMTVDSASDAKAASSASRNPSRM